GQPACRSLRVRPDAPVPAPARGRERHRSLGRLPALGGGGVGDRPAARRRRGDVAQLMARFAVTRAGAIPAVSDFERSLAFYRDTLGLGVEAVYEDPPYATLTAAGARISLAEQGHGAEDRPGVDMAAAADPSRA